MLPSDNGPTTQVRAEIHDRGRGPEIKGTRITVFAILDYALLCWPPERIAQELKVTPAQVEAGIDYVRDHKIEVLKNYIAILERNARGNPPEVLAKMDAVRGKVLELAERIREVKERSDSEIQELIRQYRDAGTRASADAAGHG